jgi:glutamine amidotransferase
MIAYVDTRIGNFGSIERAFKRLGVDLQAVRVPADIQAASALILPGVGAYRDGMASLREQGLIESLRRFVLEKRPLLGICLGMQLLFESSDEHGTQQGLGVLQGHVRRLNASGDTRHRVPNIGWCDVTPTRQSRLFPNNSSSKICYFVHSYHVAPARQEIVTATIDYAGKAVPVAIEQDNLFGLQFHPEKSQDDGLGILAAFLDGLHTSGYLSA